MNKKRMSDRKSELRLNIQDFCLSLPQNSDPIVGYLLTILQWEASLDIETNSILHKSFINQIQQIKCKLKLELKYLKGKKDETQAETHNNNIARHINQFHKLKQVFSYCLILSKKKSQLCVELQKFNEYVLAQFNLTEELENYLNEPVIFQTIFHSYLKAYNVNILTADLISFLFAQHQQKSHQKLNKSVKKEQVPRWLNPDIELLKNKTIIFKQLSDMNKKYKKLQQKLQSSYIYHLCHDFAQPEGDQNLQMKSKQDIILKQKVKKLDGILKKIKNQSGLYNGQKFTTVLFQNEPLCNLKVFQISDISTICKVVQDSKQFFLQTIYGKFWTETVIGDEQFSFMRQKIVKIEALFFLNRILAGINVISYVYNQLDLQIQQNCQFKFQNLRKLIGSEFISNETYTYELSENTNRTVFYSIDSNIKAFNVIDAQNNKILYPSAINYFFSFIKKIICIECSNKEGLLHLLYAKSQYIQSLAETVINMYQMIKVKQLSCYKDLRNYITIVLKSSCWKNLGNEGSQEEMLRSVFEEKEKIGVISQIIYEFDHNYSIKEPLQQLIRIQFDGLTKNCVSTFELYKSILYEIIEIRNGLKLDHYYSVNQIHENFSLIPPDIEKQEQKSKTKHQDLYFEDIIHEICLASQTNLYLPKLFLFFDLQLKLKRIVFKLQLCWSCKSQSMFDRKVQAFKEFLQTFSSPIFEIVGQCHTIIDILQKMEQIQRYTQIFSQEVDRFHYVEKLVSICNNYRDQVCINFIREHINRLSLENLLELNIILNNFNPIEQNKCSTRLSFLLNLSKNINSFSSIRLSQIPNFNPIKAKQLQKLSSIIVLFNLLQSSHPSDHAIIIQLYRGQKTYKNLQQILQYQLIEKKYEEWKACKSQDMDQLINYSEELFVVAILKTLRDIQQQGIDVDNSEEYQKIVKLMQEFKLSKIFQNLRSVEQIQFWRNELGIMTVYHQIYQLMYHFDSFNRIVYGKCGKKAQYKDRKLLNQRNHQVDYSSGHSDLITKLYYIFEISQLSRQKILRNIQKLEQQILETQPVHRYAAHYRNKLKSKIYHIFCQEITKILNATNLVHDINIDFNGSKQPNQYIDMLRKKMLKALAEHKNENKKDGYGGFNEIEMFREKKGYELVLLEGKQSKQYKIGVKKYMERNKKPIISPHRLQEQKAKPLQSLKRKFKLEILKKSIHIRKLISRLQLSQNKIREEIIWQTSKLQHEVKQKITQFIALSNLDQHQSYINFKHTVNIQTIKGIENVIDEQTEMYVQKKNKVINNSGEQQAFLTGLPTPNQQQQRIDRSRRLLDTNIQAMLRHMKKIKLFSAWKKTMQKTDMTKKEWCNFNINVQNILNNDKIVQSIRQIEEARDHYLKENVICQIMKEENMRVNEKIQELKISNLERKVRSYRDKLLR